MLDKVLQIFSNPEVFNTFLTILVLVISFTFQKFFEQYFKIKEDDSKTAKVGKLAAQAVFAGVDKTYQEFVRQCKAQSSDGKLTTEEKKKALQLALKYAKQYAIENGIEFGKEYGDDLLAAMIEDYITKRKSSAAVPSVNVSLPEKKESGELQAVPAEPAEQVPAAVQ
ncbi:MAG TPA: hypothetical protein PKY81_10790 [bacterium]|nr:hypothetical protein [bacterium]HPN31435.1 hypothetical protein [bacterium]